ncbi:mannose-1-phosphate guanylyltransferase/mannose-6-phosphate isomerase [Pseudoalteromonas luteoviolacea]|uniref:mannose-1-phosphate guanylyltransferase n=1 Tax=Pseudoalteromonas luteoviolacea S4054 TaxID=1129367 RepID=A0A0F6ACW0_9GAMM|nr:mannose-1-phosphate guanylyltransferase/mannose-6-phosphate isomerase [Pseudoalteromonas luteoviolacea]AOT09715.1 mannose-1-phosphate guanylyltransferase/mannose-6-phosphate isomerase [Pseudoalteromonas luteoviolacea]AOT14628.1 mannose-1-phosphate guanylyltransferase/mannose-6-phosphate isomerase [Pseudoalteromonas luteoviolacea]AOT19542.1 mannose-1-phosphate guanylyltransferase/mannose-6-phosphate isomerase [Pseudoalteromonas luteoviolacea]KKE83983.1 mannose-1-phosphate guanyltransferase [P
MILPIIMAGGSGTRLWPLSRGNYPKQFLKLHGEQTMLQETIARLEGLEAAPVMLICNEEHRFIAAEQMRQLNTVHNGIFLEPVGRNTAPAIALAAFKALEENSNAMLLVLAADHVIADKEAFQSSIKSAEALAEQGKLVTFGIVGHTPETGYGYIKRGEAIDSGYIVDRFVEKPDLKTAQGYIASGDYYWNSGMFLFKASRYLEELKLFRPDIYDACQNAVKVQSSDMDFVRIDRAAFEACPDESVDYAVMEHTQDAVVVPMDAGWNDVGGFAALWEVSEQDSQGNAFIGDVKSVDTKNTLVFGGDKLVTTVGVEDLVVIDTKDAVLVAHKDECQKVKQIVQQLKADERSEVTFHREVYRPWGKYDSVDSGDRFQVKRITVKPGAKLSVQMHHHRAEHWIVVSGTAKVQIDDTEQFVTENESVYIPITAVHALENPGKVDLELIEVQSGSYLGEDDIVRFQDRYGRVTGK